MNAIFTFLEHPTTNATIIIVVISALALVAILQAPMITKLLSSFKKQDKISTVQDDRLIWQQKIEKSVVDLSDTCLELRKFQTNHSMHEIPEMRDDIKEIKEIVNFIKDTHGNRLTALETVNKVKDKIL